MADHLREGALEAWRRAGRERSLRARDDLRRGVEEALLTLGQGLLSHPGNHALRAELKQGSLTKEAYFHQLQRLIFRFIFLLIVEGRELLHPKASSAAARKLYAEGYSIRRLREQSIRLSAREGLSDLWDRTRTVLRGIEEGEPRLALPALAGLFAKEQCPALDVAKLENRVLLQAVFHLSWMREESGLARVNWRDMASEDLGSIYEGLLELVPQLTEDGQTFAFATGGETNGNARKTTGSYYTPDFLVRELLESALEPIVKSTLAAHPGRAAQALLELAIVDPACGSGHFLLAAARRLAGHVARLQAQGTPSAEEYRHALRQVVSRCIYGVDLNPMAVELCKVSLGLEAAEPGLPLPFLGSHIRHGNALLGTTPELMAKGIPDEAWEPLEGDDNKSASALKRRNKKASEGQEALDARWSTQSQRELATIAREVEKLKAMPDADPLLKESRWQAILQSPVYRHQRLVADAWCAAFVWPKQPGVLTDAAPTNALWRQLREGQGQTPQLTEKLTEELREQYRFFHWHLEFPHVFERGGFDCVLGNPPWEHTELKEKEWFAERRPGIAVARTGAERKRMIAALRDEEPKLYAEFTQALREHDGASHFLGNSGRYPLCGRGRINLYAVFAEAMRQVLGSTGRVGCVLPTGIATDDTTRFFFQEVVKTKSLVSLFDFENKGIFPSVHSSYKFCLFTSGRGLRPTAEAAEFAFFAHTAEDLRDPRNCFTLTPDDIELLNPNTGNCPIFRSQADAALTRAIYRRVPVLVHEGKPAGNPWGLTFSQGLFNMAADSHHFRTASQLVPESSRHKGNHLVNPAERYLPLYEAKMVHQFDHRWATYSDAEDARVVSVEEKADPRFLVRPRYWVREEIVRSRLPRPSEPPAQWLMAWRDICRSTDERTTIASVVPVAACGDTLLLMYPAYQPERRRVLLLACLNSFAQDYGARQKVGGTHMKYNVFRQLAVLPPAAYDEPAAWAGAGSVEAWLLPRALELVFTTEELRPLAQACGYDGPPFRWDEARRFLLRSELDAAFFHLYLPVDPDGGWRQANGENFEQLAELRRHFPTPRDAVAHIFETFPIVKRKDNAQHGCYRTKETVLRIYDALAIAQRTRRAYVSPLSPLPATGQSVMTG
jgi:hypothetical protein